ATSAASVQEALNSLGNSLPDLIVSDIAMPDRDGYDLMRIIRQLPPTRGGELPALALTAHARPEDRLRAIAAGFQEHLCKPIASDELLATVARLAKRVDLTARMNCG